MITRHGEPVAMLVPNRKEAIREMKEFGRGRMLKGTTVKELITEERRL